MTNIGKDKLIFKLTKWVISVQMLMFFIFYLNISFPMLETVNMEQLSSYHDAYYLKQSL